MEKSFNTAGPSVPEKHYMISLDFDNFKKLIDAERYFILHAPRQTGKTTMMLQLMEDINRQGKYIALYVNVEAAQAWRNHIVEVNQTIINQFRIKALIDLPKEYQPSEAAPHLLFMAWLQRVVNGGGQVKREYAAGLGRLDLYIDFAGERFAFELKLKSKKALTDGKKQLVDYLHRLSLDSGWLVIFSRGEVKDWDAVGKREFVEERGKKIEVIWL